MVGRFFPEKEWVEGRNQISVGNRLRNSCFLDAIYSDPKPSQSGKITAAVNRAFRDLGMKPSTLKATEQIFIYSPANFFDMHILMIAERILTDPLSSEDQMSAFKCRPLLKENSKDDFPFEKGSAIAQRVKLYAEYSLQKSNGFWRRLDYKADLFQNRVQLWLIDTLPISNLVFNYLRRCVYAPILLTGAVFFLFFN